MTGQNKQPKKVKTARAKAPGASKAVGTNSSAANTPKANAPERIAKVMARAGIASRRESERLIEAGRVSVNGTILKSAAHTVTAKDVILFDGAPIAAKEPPRLWRYHKPPGLMTTHNDPKGRATVFDNLPSGLPRVISVGRLDMNSEGLLLLTNDGELARALELPSTAWARKYRARAFGRVTQDALDKLLKGVMIDGVKTGPIEATLDRQQGDNAWINVTIREGKNREVRRALDTLGLEVNRLIRLAYGPFQLGSLEKGQVDEVQRRILRDQVGHFVDIPTGRPTHQKTGPRTSRKGQDKDKAQSSAQSSGEKIPVVKKGGRTFGKSSTARSGNKNRRQTYNSKSPKSSQTSKSTKR